VNQSLYETDFIAWTEEQARLLRAALAERSNLGLDFEHLAEEIEDLGTSHADAVASQIRRIVVHLLKLQFSPATTPRRGWMESVIGARADTEWVLDEYPSLRPRVPGLIAKQIPIAVRQACKELKVYGEHDAAAAVQVHGGAFTEEEILGDWFPLDPTA
jgi:hypothetical protein